MVKSTTAPPMMEQISYSENSRFVTGHAGDRESKYQKWGTGPTAVGLLVAGPRTISTLANHVSSVAGDDDRNDVSTSFIQPFVAYTTQDAWTFALNMESTYDWKNNQWSVPINTVVSKLVSFRSQLVSLGLGARYWAVPPDSGPEGFGARAVITFLFPKWLINCTAIPQPILRR